MQLTETFNGTPAQFYAMMREFEVDRGGNGSRVAVDLNEPMRSYTYDEPSFDMFAPRADSTRIVDMFRTTTQTRHEPDVNASTPRVVLQVYLNGDETILWVTAMQMPSEKTQIKGRSGRGDSAPLWTLIVDYLRSMGWVDSRAGTVTESPKAPKRAGKGANENDRIRTTLALWAISNGKARSRAQAAVSLGIDADTIRNHEKDGRIYSDEEMEQWGDYQSLWDTYTTTLRKI